jgi:hypothetical protein
LRYGNSPTRRAHAVPEHACHELHFFLRQKDLVVLHERREAVREQDGQDVPRRVVVDADLTRYVEPWAFGV